MKNYCPSCELNNHMEVSFKLTPSILSDYALSGEYITCKHCGWVHYGRSWRDKLIDLDVPEGPTRQPNRAVERCQFYIYENMKHYHGVGEVGMTHTHKKGSQRHTHNLDEIFEPKNIK